MAQIRCVDIAIPYNWGKVKPKGKFERLELINKYGAKCFLMPGTLKFPVCNKVGAPQEGCLNCHGILTAYRRARQYKYPDVARRAIELGIQAGCDWAEKYKKKGYSGPVRICVAYKRVRTARGVELRCDRYEPTPGIPKLPERKKKYTYWNPKTGVRTSGGAREAGLPPIKKKKFSVLKAAIVKSLWEIREEAKKAKARRRRRVPVMRKAARKVK